MACRFSVSVEIQRLYMKLYDVEEEMALTMAQDGVKRRDEWLTLPAVKGKLHSWNLALAMIEGRPKRIVEYTQDGEIVFAVEYLVVVAVW